jgi:predicted ABC-type ATPase
LNRRTKAGTVKPRISVVAGTNGAGKSSIVGESLFLQDIQFFNPDDAAREVLASDPSLSLERANSFAWREGVRLLRRAIDEHRSFALETTLGGQTITELLELAAKSGIDVHVWYVALASVELHIQRVQARVERGGHDIPVPAIRFRYDQSRLNLIRLLPVIRELWIYDNSLDADPHAEIQPKPKLILHFKDKRILSSCSPLEAPEWAKPIMMECFHLSGNLPSK